ncbi:butyrophilin subfamily 2 member A2-like isoform X2 [Clinocottus analis]|uniref:butyrophilin subfamily 2 member A2-like isoform X2 n=1 Tax=Clinocottus analis TaxID=304258 RepID=UPI0035C19BE4
MWMKLNCVMQTQVNESSDPSQCNVCLSGAPRAVCQTQPIEVVENEDVLLQCHLDSRDDLSARTLDVKRNDNKQEVVCAYRDGRDYNDPQMDQYRGRTTLDHEALKRGVMNLTISSARLSDNGTYEFMVTKPDVWVFFHLIVVPRDQQNRTERRGNGTTVAPAEDEPESPDRDAAKKIILGVAAAALVVVVVVVVVLLLWKREAIKETFTGWRTTTDIEMGTTTTRQTKAGEGRRTEAGEPMLRAENGSSG